MPNVQVQPQGRLPARWLGVFHTEVSVQAGVPGMGCNPQLPPGHAHRLRRALLWMDKAPDTTHYHYHQTSNHPKPDPVHHRFSIKSPKWFLSTYLSNLNTFAPNTDPSGGKHSSRRGMGGRGEARGSLLLLWAVIGLPANSSGGNVLSKAPP